MPDGYRLNLTGLGRLVDQLARAEERMNNANKALKNAGARDLGSKAIDKAGADFQDRWEYGTDKLAKAAGKMVEGLDATKKQYQDAEHNIAQLFPAGDSGGQAPAQGTTSPNSAISRRMEGAT